MIIVPYVVMIGGAILVGVLGRKRKFGFWGYMFASLLFTPVVGLLLVLASDTPASRRSDDE